MASRAASCAPGYFQDGSIASGGARAVSLFQANAPPQGVPSTEAAIYASTRARQVKVIKPSPADDFVDAVALAPSGRLVATGDAEGRLQVWRTSDGGLAWSRQVPTIALDDLAWSPDGSELFAAGQGGMWSYSAINGSPLKSFAAPGGSNGQGNPRGFCKQNISGSCPSLRSPVVVSATRVIANYDNYELVLYDATTGRVVADIYPPGRFINTVTIAPSANGNELALSTDEGVIRTYSAANGSETGAPINLSPAASGALPIAFAGDGSVIFALDDGELSIWEAATGDLLAQQAASNFAVADDGAVFSTVTGRELASFSCSFCGGASLLLPAAHHLVLQPWTAAERSTYLEGQPPEFVTAKRA
jgi:WD40 repeat protein